jgi:hypothetical protein
MRDEDDDGYDAYYVSKRQVSQNKIRRTPKGGQNIYLVVMSI